MSDEENLGTNLRITSIIGCKRALWLAENDYKKSPKSQAFRIGNDVHDTIERFWATGEAIPELKYNIVRINRFLEWFRNNRLEIGFYEQRFWDEYGGYLYTGKIDFITANGFLYDIKSGMRKYNEKRLSLQFGGYAKLLRNNDIEVNTTRGLFLGEFMMMFRDSNVVADIDGFKKHFNEAIAVINSLHPPKFVKCSSCFTCDYRGSCKRLV